MRRTLDTILVGMGIVIGILVYKVAKEAQEGYYLSGVRDTMRKVSQVRQATRTSRR
jgi:hypothetical protein